MRKSRKLTVELYDLLDVVVAVQMDGLDTVHEFLGGMVGALSDDELRAFVETLRTDGYSRRDLDEADRHLRRWRGSFVRTAVPRSKPTKTCRQCYEGYSPSGPRDDGFCSDYCAKRFDAELGGETGEGFET